MQGYCGRLAIVDLTHRRVDYSTVPDSVLRSFIGGRGLGAAILVGMAGIVEPLAPENPLCMLVGPMTGTDFPLSNRLVFVFRSPQTRTLAWANTGGYIAAELKNGGLDGLVLLGRAETPVYLHVHGTSMRSIVRAPMGQGRPRDDRGAAGDASEARVPRDRSRRRERSCRSRRYQRQGSRERRAQRCRGSLGSKGLKAIVVDDQPSGARS